jgi:hypothetical protein
MLKILAFYVLHELTTQHYICEIIRLSVEKVLMMFFDKIIHHLLPYYPSSEPRGSSIEALIFTRQ